MDKRVVLITGALTGMGRATALAFAADGPGGRREAESRALEAELHRLGAEAVFIQADVRRDDEVGNLVDRTVARFGRLDVAVNDAS
jgi:NAD(P)-dependent dehydrogenase (short-subunit alcohol dehydrogenase family)